MVVTTKIGWRGDEALSRAILDRASIRQGTLPASAVPAEPPSGAVATEPDAGPTRSRAGVSDETMLRNQLESGYGSSPVP